MERKSREIPPPASYDPKFSQIENIKNSNINFGVGIRMTP
jgi:hypothetical protein